MVEARMRLTGLKCIVVAAALVVGLAGARADNGFLSVIEDVPLPEGLSENEAAAVDFDTADGRIAETQASGEAMAREVREFYATTLPQLGWIETAPGVFERGRENLVVDVRETAARQVSVFYSLHFSNP